MSRLPTSIIGALLMYGAGCSYCYAVTYRVTVSDDVELEPDPVIMMGSAERDDIASALPEAEVVGVNDNRTVEADGETTFHHETPVYLFAWADLDGDGTWSAGEPWAADPNNPLEHDCERYVARIEIVTD